MFLSRLPSIDSLRYWQWHRFYEQILKVSGFSLNYSKILWFSGFFERDWSRITTCCESLWKILQRHGFQAFKYQLSQHLYDDAGDSRVVFCDWLLQNHKLNLNLINFILFPHESLLTSRYVNEWASVVGNKIFWPILFQD